MGFDTTQGTASAESDAVGFAPANGVFDTFLKRTAGATLQVVDFNGNLGTLNIGTTTVSTLFRLGAAGARVIFAALASGLLTINDTAQTTGSTIKVDGTPSVSSGFGTSPSVTAGSTAFAGSVNVGTGGAATSGVIAFNGSTNFPSVPFVVVCTQLTNAVTRAVATTSGITFTTTTAWTSGDIVSWICVGSRS